MRIVRADTIGGRCFSPREARGEAAAANTTLKGGEEFGALGGGMGGFVFWAWGAGGRYEFPGVGGLPVVEGCEAIEIPEEHLARLVTEC